MTKPLKSNQMWGGRFTSSPSDIMLQINASIDIDQRLWREDIMASKAHCEMLIAQSIIPKNDGQNILDGLDKIWT